VRRFITHFARRDGGRGAFVNHKHPRFVEPDVLNYWSGEEAYLKSWEPPTTSSARNEEALRQNLTKGQVAKFEAANASPLAYPSFHQRGFERNPSPVA
jgi:hypothetical protein